MKKSNYELMRDRMRGEFVKYNQEKMIQKFGLSCDDDFLYLTFVSRDYRINRENGTVEWSEDGFCSSQEANYNESMTIYDVLCYSKADCRPADKFCPLPAVKGVTKTLAVQGGMFQEVAQGFQKNLPALKAACRALGEPIQLVGDVTARLRAFPFLAVTFQFWEADEEFPPSLKFMYDENILDYMHFETVYFMTWHILERLREVMEEC